MANKAECREAASIPGTRGASRSLERRVAGSPLEPLEELCLFQHFDFLLWPQNGDEINSVVSCQKGVGSHYRSPRKPWPMTNKDLGHRWGQWSPGIFAIGLLFQVPLHPSYWKSVFFCMAVRPQADVCLREH